MCIHSCLNTFSGILLKCIGCHCNYRNLHGIRSFHSSYSFSRSNSVKLWHHNIEHNGVKTGPAICYEGLYGDFYGGFVRRGAQFMAIISNDGWWGDTPGYKHLFSISRLRAVEHRRAIARSANTGKSGFISARGDVGQTLGWEQRGVITAEVPLNSELTFYTRYGDCLARISEYILLLSVLYYVAYRYKRRNHLVK